MMSRRIANGYLWEDFRHPKLLELRQKYKLKKVVEEGKSEFERQLLLKDWVNRVLPRGFNPRKKYLDSLEILADAKSGQFYCSHFSLLFIQSATSLGWFSRKLGIDYDHEQGEEERHHGVADIWSNDFQK